VLRIIEDNYRHYRCTFTNRYEFDLRR